MTLTDRVTNFEGEIKNMINVVSRIEIQTADQQEIDTNGRRNATAKPESRKWLTYKTIAISLIDFVIFVLSLLALICTRSQVKLCIVPYEKWLYFMLIFISLSFLTSILTIFYVRTAKSPTWLYILATLIEVAMLVLAIFGIVFTKNTSDATCIQYVKPWVLKLMILAILRALPILVMLFLAISCCCIPCLICFKPSCCLNKGILRIRSNKVGYRSSQQISRILRDFWTFQI